jgi:inosine-uridine nucleoside N-ribohydrolase
MIGLDVTHQALITDAHTEELRGRGRVGTMVAELMDFYSRFHRTMYPDLAGSPMHDPVAVAHVALPGLVDVRDASITVDCGWDQGRGRTNVDWRGRQTGGPPNAKVAVGIDADRFARTVIDRVTSLA